MRAGLDMKETLRELFWAGMDALNSGLVTLQDMKELEELGRRMEAEKAAVIAERQPDVRR